MDGVLLNVRSSNAKVNNGNIYHFSQKIEGFGGRPRWWEAWGPGPRGPPLNPALIRSVGRMLQTAVWYVCGTLVERYV